MHTIAVHVTPQLLQKAGILLPSFPEILDTFQRQGTIEVDFTESIFEFHLYEHGSWFVWSAKVAKVRFTVQGTRKFIQAVSKALENSDSRTRLLDASGYSLP